ncbi:MAG: guanylate kinase [Clostridia bacterium]|nr:guanylate kinase [Clostridia bacterium]
MEKGLLIVLSGPSGSGKGTVRAELMKKEHFAFSVSATTRGPREGERNDVDYHFITREAFEGKIQREEMLEYTTYNGNYYGTVKSEALEMIEAGKNLLLEIEVEGAMNVKRVYPEAVLIMLLPPSFAEQERRLRGRGTESDEIVNGRLARTYEEMEYLPHYDYVVYNENVDACAEDILSIIHAERCAMRRHPNAKEHYFGQ